MANSKFVVAPSKDGKYYFDLYAANDAIIGTSETYESNASCVNGIESVKTCAPIASVEDQTVEGFAKESAPKFEIFNDVSGGFRFRLIARNGQIILASEGYTEKTGCKNGIESVKTNAPDAVIEYKA